MIRAAVRAAFTLLLVHAAACDAPPLATTVHSTPYPEHLAAWGLVGIDDRKLILAERVLPYDLATPLFSDYAHKLRTVWLPPDTSATYHPTGVFDFPVGTIVSKTFYYPRAANVATLVLATENTGTDSAAPGLDLNDVRLVETRLLVRAPAGWTALAYVWNDAQDDAMLQIAGAVVPLDAVMPDGTTTTLQYLVPTKNDCANCHTTDLGSRSIQPIGLAARHLDKTYERYADGHAPQLARWREVGYLAGDADGGPAPNALWAADATDHLDHRARSYLDINCGHCHSRTGPADTSGLFLDAAETSLRRLGACKPPVAAGRGTGGHANVILPGKPDASILVYRLQTIDPGEMMPELGRTVAHTAGVNLISRWVGAMSHDCG